MYVDPKPVSTYQKTQNWKMPSPQPAGTLKHPIPNYASSNSSQSSLRNMEQPIPSFQNFVKRTPPLDHSKPLPPTPLQPRRSSYFESNSSRSASSSGRRSSSVYSRTTSQWDPDWASDLDVPDVPALPAWQSVDFADHDNLLLRAIAYSASTSKLLEKQQAAQLLEARTYSPLINTPSPTVSRDSSLSPPPYPRPSVLLPPPPASVQVPKKHLRMVSLEKAKALMQAPGAVHLLPEELRAQRLGKARSQEPLRVNSMDMFARSPPPELPENPTLIDSQGRERLVGSPTPSIALTQPVDFSALNSPVREDADSSLFHVGNGAARTMAPVASQRRKASRNKVTQALGLGDADEPRGRTQTRGPRNMSYDHYTPNAKRTSDSSETSGELQSDAQKIAQEYHSLLSEQYRQSSDSPISSASASDLDVRTHMKMVPQPLFHHKPAVRPSGEASSVRSSQHSVSPLNTRVDSGTGGSLLRNSSYTRGSFPLRLSNSLRMRSTSGSIPISPPPVFISKMATVAPIAPELQPRQEMAHRRKSVDDRKSSYYPHVMSRKPKKEKKEKRRMDKMSSPLQGPSIPMLAADIIAQRLTTPDSTPGSSPVQRRPIQDNMRRGSEAASVDSNNSSRPLHQRMFKSATKYADKLSPPTSSQARKYVEEPARRMSLASPESPQLLSSPVSGKQPPAVHLGWSDHAKTTFDRVRSSVQSPRHHPQPLVTHIITAAKPLDDSRTGLREPESPGKTGSIFGGLMDGWRESKAEKRRDDLKKMIKLVTPEESGGDGVGEGRPDIESKRSSFGWL
ncbi:hypothetical protein LTR08_005296 [Meristemomyces frigidus]|nr:hypothetical protein LTR08_005296 [Meristemomyces frigidus]